MIPAAGRIVVRSLLDLSLVLLVASGLLALVAYRIIRRLVATGDTRLEGYARNLAGVLALVAAARSRAGTDT